MTSSQLPKDSPADPEPGSFAARLKQQYGEGVDPEVSLDRAAPEVQGSAPSGVSSALLRRLADHSLKESRYKLLGEIARGGMGAILRVWDEDLRRTLAMKVILGKGESPTEGGTAAIDTRTLGRFLEEAQITGQLDHPGIAPVHELGIDSDGRVYFTMKLVKGRDLKHIFDLVFEEKEGWNETRALSVMLKVCEAMAYAHKKGVIHRDLKPANVMVGGFGEVYVMDWGLARVLGRKDTHDIRLRPESESTHASVKSGRREEREDAPDSPLVTMDGDVMGTPAYMPPEQARGEIEKLSARSDVYALGAMLYHLLARCTPYAPPGAKVSNHMVLLWVLEGPPKRLHELRPEIPAELAAICEKAMSRDAAQRYPDTLALAEDLRAYLEHRVVAAYETGAVAELKKWIGRNKPLAAASAAAIVLLIGGLVVSSTLYAKADENARVAKVSEDRAKEQGRRADAEAERARLAASESERQETLAKATLEDVLSLSAVQELTDLTMEADALWPAEPALLAQYDGWLERARLLVEGRPPDPTRDMERQFGLEDHKRKLAEIRLRSKGGTLIEDVGSADVEASSEERVTYEFDDARDRWWNAQLAKLIADLESFRDPQSGLFSSGMSVEHAWGIVRRREFAATIEERSVSGPEAARRWAEAIDAIATSERYRGVTWSSGERMTPQLGLMPIGVDPESGLWEFAHLATGEPAERGAGGRLIVTATTGVVLVLLPGGVFWMGAQSTDPTGTNYDPQSVDNETPVHEVTLSAYMLSKYEMTQGQWLRVAGRNPSNYGPSTVIEGYRHGLTHPVEQVTWSACMELMERVGLELPSEAQWEYGCRAGTDTPWWTGAERESLRGKINLADQTAEKAGASWTDIKEWPDLEDGWVVHAPVGSLAANPFGLHEVHGNVAEWCRDGYDNYPATQSLDPVTPWIGATHRVRRGGSFGIASFDARSADRGNSTPEYQDGNLGLRPARGLSTR